MSRPVATAASTTAGSCARAPSRGRVGRLPGPVDLTDPVYDYDHVVGRSITGGYVYRGPAPGLEGAYFFADFVTSRLFTLRVVDGVAEDAIDRTDQVVGADLSSISSFGTDSDGNLYAVSISGEIYRLDPSAGAGDGADRSTAGSATTSLFGGIGQRHPQLGAHRQRRR